MAEIRFTAELAGRIISISASEGKRVELGDEVVVLESMKMEIPLTAQVAGIVTAVHVQIDDMVDEGQTLLTLET
jgi:acetyl-CoA carboxylase biotin carboxyl carrier protein